MIKKAIFYGARVGAVTGAASATTYVLIVLIIAELVLPLSNPSTVIIFDQDFFRFIFPLLVITSPFWLFSSVLIGLITASIFGLLFVKIYPKKKNYVLACILFCIVIALIPYIIVASNLLASLPLDKLTNMQFEARHSFVNPTIDIGLTIAPTFIYIIVGAFVSQYLYLHLESLRNVQSFA